MFLAASYCIVGILIQLATCALSFGIVWHVANLPEMRRTLINRLISCHAVITAVFIMNGVNGITLIYLTSRLGASTCDMLFVGIIWFLASYLLSSDIIIVTCYLFTCAFKSAKAFNDDLLFRFTQIMLLLLPLYFALLSCFFGLHANPLYFMCLGVDAGHESQHNFAMIRALLAFGIISVVLHVMLHYKMTAHNAKAEKGATKWSIVNSGASLGYFVIHVFNDFAMLALVIGVSKMLDISMEDIVPFAALWGQFLLGVVLQANTYRRNKELQSKVASMYRKMFRGEMPFY